MSTPEPAEIPLEGGRANVGRVVRIGDEVARPVYPQTETVEHFLRFLRSKSIDFVPEPLGNDSQGRQRLTFIEGRVPIAPHPAWAYDADLLADVARRQRQLHLAVVDYVPPADAVWAVSAGDYFPSDADGDLVCHNDLGLANTIVDMGQPAVTGFIDFDYCRPVNRLFDIAVTARHWVPFGSLDMAQPLDLDRLGRFHRFCDAHELDASERSDVVDLAIAFLEHARRNITRLAADGNPGFVELMANGYAETNKATIDWIRTTLA